MTELELLPGLSQVSYRKQNVVKFYGREVTSSTAGVSARRADILNDAPLLTNPPSTSRRPCSE